MRNIIALDVSATPESLNTAKLPSCRKCHGKVSNCSKGFYRFWVREWTAHVLVLSLFESLLPCGLQMALQKCWWKTIRCIERLSPSVPILQKSFCTAALCDTCGGQGFGFSMKVTGPDCMLFTFACFRMFVLLFIRFNCDHSRNLSRILSHARAQPSNWSIRRRPHSKRG